MPMTAMADLVVVLNKDGRWDEVGLGEIARMACAATLRHLQFDPVGFEISLLGCDDAHIAGLNAQFRSKTGATNVLAWPSQALGVDRAGAVPAAPNPADGPVHELGDIAIAFETCDKEAKAAKKPFSGHVNHLLVHATLHLLGYDHIVKEDGDLMQETERQVLATLGQPDPYKDD